MDDSVLISKIESLSRCMTRIRQKTPEDISALERDIDLQDIITLNLERAVQICVDMGSHVLALTDAPAPASMVESFDLLRQIGAIDAAVAERMGKAVGFRNLAVHEYIRIDWMIVFAIITKHLDDFRAFSEQLLLFSADLDP
jgi:uncharacterized protein YutE (UPF0331/DUF86 family)